MISRLNFRVSSNLKSNIFCEFRFPDFKPCRSRNEVHFQQIPGNPEITNRFLPSFLPNECCRLSSPNLVRFRKPLYRTDKTVHSPEVFPLRKMYRRSRTLSHSVIFILRTNVHTSLLYFGSFCSSSLTTYYVCVGIFIYETL